MCELQDVLSNGAQSRAVKQIVQKQIQEAMDRDIVLIPMLPSGVSKDGRTHGDHWILLKFDVLTGKWTFYNSMMPKKSPLDPYLARFGQIVSFCFVCI